MKHNMKEDPKNIQREAEVHVEALKALESEVIGLIGTFQNSL